MLRLNGWSRPLGLYVDSAMVRVLGLIEEPETEEERIELHSNAAAYWSVYHREETDPFRNELIARIGPINLDHAQFLQMEAAVISRPGISAELYPEFFNQENGLVDKDGLTDYRYLLGHTHQVQPGVFHDPHRDLLLFAHRFFRRGFSHRNKLNSYFLQSLVVTAEGYPDLRVRLKLDPDLLGHPASAQNLIELEYWRGPLYSDDIGGIPTGVAEHKADERSRFFHGIDRTQVWWKAPEHRDVDGAVADFRTLEVEELVENPAGGLGDDRFGCRYAHAEFSMDAEAITHFDGAIRAYSGDAYLKRIDTSINRAGKNTDYTKVFRFDGVLAVSRWKRLLSDYFLGNNLIPEYLGASAELDQTVDLPDTLNVPTPASSKPTLAALISLTPGTISGPLRLGTELCYEVAGQAINFAEVGVGAVEAHVRSRIDLDAIATVGFRDDNLNLSRLIFSSSGNLKMAFDVEVPALADALSKDAEAGVVNCAAIPLTWEFDGMLVTLTVAGQANKVSSVLRRLVTLVDPAAAPSEWIEALANVIAEIAPEEHPLISWEGVNRGVLAIDRPEVVPVQMHLPDSLMQQVQQVLGEQWQSLPVDPESSP
jgi:hypothetical protein